MRPLPEFHWIIENRLAGASKPGLMNPLHEDLEYLRQRGVGVIINLTEVSEEEPEAFEGFTLRHFPVVDMSIPTPRAAAELCQQVASWLAAGQAVMMHCHAGLGRTGTLLACMLISFGHTADAAVTAIRRHSPNYIQSQAQEVFVRHFETFQSSHAQGEEVQLPRPWLAR